MIHGDLNIFMCSTSTEQSSCSAAGERTRLTDAGMCYVGELSPKSRGVVEYKHTLMKFTNPSKNLKLRIHRFQYAQYALLQFSFCKLWAQSFRLPLDHGILTWAWSKAPLTRGNEKTNTSLSWTQLKHWLVQIPRDPEDIGRSDGHLVVSESSFLKLLVDILAV